MEIGHNIMHGQYGRRARPFLMFPDIPAARGETAAVANIATVANVALTHRATA
jgi:hypothetical protein